MIGNRRLSLLCFLSLQLFACSEEAAQSHFNGYIETIHVYVASPQAGWLEESVALEGAKVEVGDLLVRLDDEAQAHAVEQAKAQLSATEHQLMDLQQGARPEEIAVVKKLLDSQQARLSEARSVFLRQKQLLSQQLTSKDLYDRAKASLDAAIAQVEQTTKQLKVLDLPAREHTIEAIRDNVEAAKEALAIKQWELKQRSIAARNQGIVDQIFYRQGEFVKSGVPILSLIVSASQKARFYVPQAKLSALQPGHNIQVTNDEGKTVNATITYIAAEAEFAPPVLYSKDSRDDLVFMVEAQLAKGASMRPGQPVDVEL